MTKFILKILSLPQMDKDKFLKDFGKHLRKVRNESGISIREMELRGDLSRQIISKMELGQNNSSVTSLRKYAAALEMDLEELFHGFKK